MHVAGCLGGEEGGRAFEIVGVPPTARRNAVQDGLAADGIGTQRRGVVRGNVAGGDGVNIDPARGPLVRQSLRELPYPAFARRVARHRDAALEGEQRRGEDNFPASPRDHFFSDLAAEDERGAEVGLNHTVPEVVRVLDRGLSLDGSSVVDQDVDHGKVVFDFGDEPIQGLPVGEVGPVSTEAAPCAFHCVLHLAAGWAERGADADDIGPGFGEARGDSETDTAAASGDQSRFAGQRKKIQSFHGCGRSGGVYRQSIRTFIAEGLPRK